MNPDEFLKLIASHLESSGIAYMAVGSYASGLHGQPRATRDLDLVIDPTSEQLHQFLSNLGDDYYYSGPAAMDALGQRSMFNVISLESGWKVDLIIRKDRPYSVAEFARRRPIEIDGRAYQVASPEDSILSKLEWNHISPSERQVQDALHVANVRWKDLDFDYLRKWADELGLRASLEQTLRQAEEFNLGGGP